MKNLYLPGINKNVGYLDGDMLHIYKRYRKYLPLTFKNTGNIFLILPLVGVPIFTQKEKNTEKYIQLYFFGGISFDPDKQEWVFYNCTFKTPDNLDVIEMTFLYKNWTRHGQTL